MNIMPSISEEILERRDEVDGFRLEVAKVELYLKQLILSIRFLITVLLMISLVRIVSNFFAPTNKDQSE